MANATKGPWLAEIDDDEGCFNARIVGPRGDEICELLCGNDELIESTKANAHLIAASPDLLAALEKCKQAIIDGEDLLWLLDDVTKAIAKAKGK